MDKLSIDGQKIRIRDMKVDDLNPFRQWQQPGHAWQRLDGPYYAKPTSAQVDENMKKIRLRVEAAQWPPIRTRLVIADRQTDDLVGMISRYWISEETHWTAVGIAIFDPEMWGYGLGYEALGLWTEYLFDQYPEWVRVDLRTWSGNHGMMGLALKLGYREEARFRQARIVDGEYYDGLGYGVLRTEWRAKYPNGFAAALATD